MSRFIRIQSKPETVEATQWFKNGDHPDDNVMRPFEDTGKIPTEPREGAVVRYFRDPSRREDEVCRYCSYTMNVHGWIDHRTYGAVCPGDWVVTAENGVRYSCKPDVFARAFEPAERLAQPTRIETTEKLITENERLRKALMEIRDLPRCTSRQIAGDALKAEFMLDFRATAATPAIIGKKGYTPEEIERIREESAWIYECVKKALETETGPATPAKQVPQQAKWEVISDSGGWEGLKKRAAEGWEPWYYCDNGVYYFKRQITGVVVNSV